MFWIVVCFLTGLWPLGVFLLLKREGVFSRLGKPAKKISGFWAVVLAFALYKWLSDYSSFVIISLAVGCAAIVLLRYIRTRQERRDKKYLAFAAHRAYIPLAEIAKAIPTSVSAAARDLERLIGEGQFGDGVYLDMSRKLLVLDSVKTAEEYTVYEEVVVEPEPEEEETPPRTETSGDDFEEKLEAIRQVNRQIRDEAVSYKIYRIEAVSSDIFSAVRADPSKRPQATSFMNYYLPTTLKLLTRYAQLEKHTAPGPNVRKSMQDIAQVLDKLLASFEALLDRLYQNDTIDITAEISALETMMARDGGAANPYTFESMKK